MEKKSILITGASGFTGSYVVRAAVRSGLHCIAIARDKSNIATDVHENIIAPLEDRSAVMAAVNAAQPDYVIHLAAISFVAHPSNAEIYKANLIGTVNLLDALKTAIKVPERVVIASSANVYGQAEQLPITESTPLRPSNHYGMSKYFVERAAALYAELPVSICRPFNYTGCGQSASFVVPKLVDAYKRGYKEVVLGDIEVERDFSDVRDVAAAYMLLLEADTGAYNIASGRPISLSKVLELLGSISEHQVVVKQDPKLFRQGEIRVSYGCTRLLEENAGYCRRYSFEDTLEWMLNA
ncbi:MAG: GDP-mannose 4,6-dehydratase [Pseudomonadota bacterium]